MARFHFNWSYGFFVFFGKLVWLPKWVFLPQRFINIVFDFLPSFYAVGACCCDHGGHVRRWYPVWFLADRNIRHWKDFGDGPDVFSRMSLFGWTRWRLHLWKQGKYSEHVNER